jgi:hypothetical protein
MQLQAHLVNARKYSASREGVDGEGAEHSQLDAGALLGKEVKECDELVGCQ